MENASIALFQLKAEKKLMTSYASTGILNWGRVSPHACFHRMKFQEYSFIHHPNRILGLWFVFVHIDDDWLWNLSTVDFHSKAQLFLVDIQLCPESVVLENSLWKFISELLDLFFVGANLFSLSVNLEISANTIDAKMAKPVDEILSTENPVFSTFIVYASILIIKMMLMSLLTNFFRIRAKVFLNILLNSNKVDNRMISV